MRKFRKWAMIAACAVLLVCVSIGATVAYLTSQSTVTNTFTVGNVAITMDETKVGEDGAAAASADRVTSNAYKLLPGHTYTKDPIVHVAAGSEDCWVFVKVENDIAAIEDANSTIAAQLTANGWKPVAGANGVYGRDAAARADDNLTVFSSFKISGTVNNTTLATYAGKSIVVTAYAIQADGFADAAAAWTALGVQ